MRRHLDVLCRSAVDVVDGAEHAGVTVLQEGTLHRAAGNDPVAATMDQIRIETGEGPGAEDFDGGAVSIADLAEDGRWPQFAARAVAETRVRSLLGMRLWARADVVGVLNLYSTRPQAFPVDSGSISALIAAHFAAIVDAAGERDRADRLEEGLASNRRIGTAVGILMCRHTITEEKAFQLLRTASQNSNRKLREIADEVVHTGHLEHPGRPVASPRVAARPGA